MPRKITDPRPSGFARSYRRRVTSASGIVRSRWILAAVSTALFCVQIDYFAMNLALPRMASDLNSNATDLQWVISVYMLALGAFMVPAGRIGDIFGRRRALLAGIALFGLRIGVVCGCADGRAGHRFPRRTGNRRGADLPGVGQRADQRLSRCARQPRDRIGLRDSGSGQCGGTVGRRLADPDAGLAVDLLVVGAVCVGGVRDWRAHGAREFGRQRAAAHRRHRPGVDHHRNRTCSRLTFDRAPNWGWLAPGTIIAFVASIAVLVVFVFVEKRVRWPLLDLSLFGNARFTVLVVAGTVANIAYAVTIYLSTLNLQQVRGLDPLMAGLAFLGPSIGAALGGPLSGRLAAKYSAGARHGIRLHGCRPFAGGAGGVARLGSST